MCPSSSCLCAKTVAYFALDRDELTEALRHRRAIRHHGTRRLVGKICNECEGAAVEFLERVCVERAFAVEAIAFDQREAGLSCEVLAKERAHVAVKFNCDQLCAAQKDLFAHRACAWTDFKHNARWTDPARVNEFAE